LQKALRDKLIVLTSFVELIFEGYTFSKICVGQLNYYVNVNENMFHLSMYTLLRFYKCKCL